MKKLLCFLLVFLLVVPVASFVCHCCHVSASHSSSHEIQEKSCCEGTSVSAKDCQTAEVVQERISSHSQTTFVGKNFAAQFSTSHEIPPLSSILEPSKSPPVLLGHSLYLFHHTLRL